MIAKLVVHGADRAAALRAMESALVETEIAGTTTNTPFLAALIRHEGFAAGDVDTGLIDRDLARLIVPAAIEAGAKELAILYASGLLKRAVLGDPWTALRGYSHNSTLAYPVVLEEAGHTIRYGVSVLGDERYAITGADTTIKLRVRHEPASWHVTGKGINLRAKTVTIPHGIAVLSKGGAATFTVADPFLLAEAAGNAGDRLTAPMPGLVKSVRVATGDLVKKGQILLVLEAMKMEHTITAPHDGTIAEIAGEGMQVKENSSLVRFEEVASVDSNRN
jgi:3-methylcrotonyl-CoA carboxylase alpha subunit